MGSSANLLNIVDALEAVGFSPSAIQAGVARGLDVRTMRAHAVTLANELAGYVGLMAEIVAESGIDPDAVDLLAQIDNALVGAFYEPRRPGA